MLQIWPELLPHRIVLRGVSGSLKGLNVKMIRCFPFVSIAVETHCSVLNPQEFAMRLKSRLWQWLKVALADSARGHHRGDRLRGSGSRIESLEARTLLSAIVVTSLADNTALDGLVTLREAIQAANTDSSVDGSVAGNGADLITFTSELKGQILMNGSQMSITDATTITGNGSYRIVIDAQYLSRIFDIAGTAGNVTLNDLTFIKGRTTGNGTSFDDTTFAGGAVRWLSQGILTVNRSTFGSNSTLGDFAGGGAILANTGTLIANESSFSGNSTSGINSEGGAISAHAGFLQVRNCTLDRNSTTGNYSEGGALFSVFGNVTISQSTLSGNSISGIDSQGGGLFTQQGFVFITQSTITENATTSSIGGGIFTLTSPMIIFNSIVAGNSDVGLSPDIRKSPDSDDVFFITSSLIGRNNGIGLAATSGATPDASGNFIGGATPQTALNPLLRPLEPNGGPTLTRAFLPGSLAIDHGSNTLAIDGTNGNAALTTDQRGVPSARILDGDHLGVATVDIGAFEFSGLRVISPNPNAFSLRPTFTWTPIAGATSYIIQINNESTNVAHFHDATTTVASYTPTVDLAIGKFKMWVRPVFAAGPGNWSAPQLFNNLTPATWQSMPRTQLTSRPTLSWNALPGAAKYDLWVNNLSTGEQVFRQDVTGTSFTPATDLPMGFYRAWIRGIDAKGNFANWSVLQEALVVPAPTPIAPLSSTFDRTPTFTWNPVAGAVSYELYVKSQITGAMVINGISTVDTNFTPATNLTDGTYRWWTVSVSAASLGPIKSGGTTVIDIYVGGRPTIIAPAAGSSTSDRTPVFTWKAVDGAASYQLQVNRISVPQAIVISQVGLTTTDFTPVSDLAAGTYRAWVRAVSNTNELSPWSIEVNFTVTAFAPTIDSLDADLMLTGLLMSELASGNERDVNTHPSKVVVNTQPNQINDEAMVELAAPVVFSSPSARPAIDHQRPDLFDLDRMMMEFTMDQFLPGER